MHKFSPFAEVDGSQRPSPRDLKSNYIYFLVSSVLRDGILALDES
jgi:hypothetical protein